MTKRDILVQAAHFAVRTAIKEGLLRALVDGETDCVDCGKAAVLYDHRNYYQPLEVVPVCKGCNSRRGPGEPLPTAEDGAWAKHGIAHVHGWNSLEGGNGWTPLEWICHVTIDAARESAFDLSLRHTFTYFPEFSSRSAYFKAHDPWRL